MAIAKSDDLGANAAACRCDHFAKISHGHSRPARGDEQTHEFDDFARPGQQFQAANAGDVRIQIDKLRRSSYTSLQLIDKTALDLGELRFHGRIQRAAADFENGTALGLHGIADHGDGLPAAV